MMFDVFVRDIIGGSLCCGVEIFSNKEQERREEGGGRGDKKCSLNSCNAEGSDTTRLAR